MSKGKFGEAGTQPVSRDTSCALTANPLYFPARHRLGGQTRSIHQNPKEHRYFGRRDHRPSDCAAVEEPDRAGGESLVEPERWRLPALTEASPPTI
jgi:hypothetical protein